MGAALSGRAGVDYHTLMMPYLFLPVSTVGIHGMKDAPSLDGLILSAPTAPYVLESLPALAEFQQAIRTYGKNLRFYGAGTPQGWAEPAEHDPEMGEADHRQGSGAFWSLV